jgi:maleylacetate reductase
VLQRTVVHALGLLVSLSARLAVASWLDPTAHIVEGLCAPDSSPITALMAEEGVWALTAALP